MPALYDEFKWMLEQGNVLRLRTRTGEPLVVGRSDAVSDRLSRREPAQKGWVVLHPTGRIAVADASLLFTEVLQRVNSRHIREVLRMNRYSALFPQGCSLGWHARRHLGPHRGRAETAAAGLLHRRASAHRPSALA